MALYQEMDPQELQEILDCYRDQQGYLADEKKKEDAFLRQFACLRCGGETQSCFSTVQTIYNTSEPLPQLNLRCLACGCEFNPRNSVIYKLGNIGKAIESAQAQQTPWIKTCDDEP